MTLAFPEPDRLIGITKGLQKKFPEVEAEEVVATTLLDLCEGRLSYDRGPQWFYGACVRNAIRIVKAEQVEQRKRRSVQASEGIVWRLAEDGEYEQACDDSPVILEPLNRHVRRHDKRRALVKRRKRAAEKAEKEARAEYNLKKKVAMQRRRLSEDVMAQERERQAKWREEHREEERERQRKYRAKQKSRKEAELRRRERYANDPEYREKRRARSREWQARKREAEKAERVRIS